MILLYVTIIIIYIWSWKYPVFFPQVFIFPLKGYYWMLYLNNSNNLQFRDIKLGLFLFLLLLFVCFTEDFKFNFKKFLLSRQLSIKE